MPPSQTWTCLHDAHGDVIDIRGVIVDRRGFYDGVAKSKQQRELFRTLPQLPTDLRSSYFRASGSVQRRSLPRHGIGLSSSVGSTKIQWTISGAFSA